MEGRNTGLHTVPHLSSFCCNLRNIGPQVRYTVKPDLSSKSGFVQKLSVKLYLGKRDARVKSGFAVNWGFTVARN